MFWTDEDVQPAVSKAVELFGTAGIMHYGKNVKYNVSLATKEYGKFWYGDIDMNDETFVSACKSLSDTIGQTLYIFNAENTYDFRTAVSVN